MHDSRRHVRLQLPGMARHVLSGGLPDRRRCSRFYAARFHTVEINYTFYRMPTPKTTDGWLRAGAARVSPTRSRRRSASRTIQRLKDCEDYVAVLLREPRACSAPHLGPLLFQLPPTFKCDLGAARGVSRRAAGGHARRVRVPPRLMADRRGLRAARARTAPRCASPTSATRRRRCAPTARHGYFRLRDEGYTPADLERWADAIAAQARRLGRRVRVLQARGRREGAGVRARVHRDA